MERQEEVAVKKTKKRCSTNASTVNDGKKKKKTENVQESVPAIAKQANKEIVKKDEAVAVVQQHDNNILASDDIICQDTTSVDVIAEANADESKSKDPGSTTTSITTLTTTAEEADQKSVFSSKASSNKIDKYIYCTKIVDFFFKEFDICDVSTRLVKSIFKKILSSSTVDEKQSRYEKIVIECMREFENENIKTVLENASFRVVELWEKESLSSKKDGISLHEYIENKIRDLNFVQREKKQHFLGFDIFFEEWKKSNFVKEIEYKIYDHEKKIVGCVDAIFKNDKDETILVDWKLVNDFDCKTRFDKCKSPLEHLPANNNTKYALQMNLYKYILEKKSNGYDINIDYMYIIKFLKNFKLFEIQPIKILNNIETCIDEYLLQNC